jgi:putative transposase
MPESVELKRALVEADHPQLSVRRQCDLLGLCRSSLCYQPATETPENLNLMKLIDKQYTACSWSGYGGV